MYKFMFVDIKIIAVDEKKVKVIVKYGKVQFFYDYGNVPNSTY